MMLQLYKPSLVLFNGKHIFSHSVERQPNILALVVIPVILVFGS